MKHLVYRVLRNYCSSNERHAGVDSCNRNNYDNQIVDIPSFIEVEGESVPVTFIGSEAFKGENILGVIIPYTVDNIYGDAFQNCKNLKSINIPTGIDRIHWGTFLGCSNLEEIFIPNTVNRIFERVFEGCTNLKEVKLPENLIEIRSSAFYNCKSLMSIVLPKNLIHIREHAFYGCENLTFYSELSSKLSTWHDNWKDSSRPIYWVGEWSYDANGKPQPNLIVR